MIKINLLEKVNIFVSDDYDRYIGIIDEAEKIEVVIKDRKIKRYCKAKLKYPKYIYINYLIQYFQFLYKTNLALYPP